MKKHFRWICTSMVVLLMISFAQTTFAQGAAQLDAIDITARVPIFKQVYETAKDATLTQSQFETKITATAANLQEWEDVVGYYANEGASADTAEKEAAEKMYNRINFIIQRQN